MYSAPVDQTVFQTVIFAIASWFVYTFFYKPVVYGPDPLTFTTDDVLRIIHTGVHDFYAECVLSATNTRYPSTLQKKFDADADADTDADADIAIDVASILMDLKKSPLP